MHVLILLRHRQVIDYRKEGELTWYYFYYRIIRRLTNIGNLLEQPVLLEYVHFSLKHVLVVELEQLLVGKVDAKLLETVEIEIFKPEDIQNING